MTYPLPSSTRSYVISPLAVRAMFGMVAPYASTNGKADLVRAYQMDEVALHRVAVSNIQASSPLASVVAGLWLDPSQKLNKQARKDLEGFIHTYSKSDKPRVTRWMSEATSGVTPDFIPGDSFGTGLYGVCAVSSRWDHMTVGAVGGDEFWLRVAPSQIRVGDNGATIVAALQLQSGSSLVVSHSKLGLPTAMLAVRRVSSDWGQLEVLPGDSSEWAEPHPIRTPATPAVGLSTSQRRSSYDLLGSARSWGAGGLRYDGLRGLTKKPIRLTNIKHQARIDISIEGVFSSQAPGVPGPIGVQRTEMSYRAKIETPFAFAVYDSMFDIPMLIGQFVD